MVNASNYKTYSGLYNAYVISNTPPPAAFLREFYKMLRAYYEQNGLYDIIRSELKTIAQKSYAQEVLRNPANRTVEFYASKMWPGKLPDAVQIETSNSAIIQPIEQIWKWSNFGSRKQRMARWLAIYGDLFLKVNSTERSIYFESILPDYVTDMELDPRGFLTYIRLDIPDDIYMHTEIWSKESQLVKVWRHKQGWDIEEERLGNADTVTTFQESHGEDFIPIVYQPFKDDGMGRGMGAFTHVLDKIDHVNMSATRLAQILFRHNRPVWAALGGKDASGRPLPPPTLELDTNSEFSLDDDEIISLSGASDIKSLVPNLNYGDALAVLQDDMNEIEHDLPELAYYKIRDMNEVSGKAVMLLLDDAMSRLDEAQGNAQTALQRIDEMALTIGQNVGIFSGLGTYDSGAFDHNFIVDDPFPIEEMITNAVVNNTSNSNIE